MAAKIVESCGLSRLNTQIFALFPWSMTPFSDFTYFGLLLYIVLPTLALGLLGRANRRWTLLATVLVAVLNFSDDIALRPGVFVHELWIALGFAVYQGALAAVLLRWKSTTLFRVARQSKRNRSKNFWTRCSTKTSKFWRNFPARPDKC